MAQKQRLLEDLKSAFHSNIPRGIEIVNRAIDVKLAGRKPAWIKQNFSVLVESIQVEAYRIYVRAEKKAAALAFKQVFTPLARRKGKPADVIELIYENFYAIDKLFLSLTNGRRSRAGSALEVIIRHLFQKLKYPFTSQPAIIEGKPDFVLPSIAHFETQAMDAIIFTVKRSLRERWRQIVTEGTHGLGFFLGTIDKKIAKGDLTSMNKARIYLVVPKNVKVCRPDYKLAANVITFEDFFKFHLDPAMRRWRARHVI
jgi:hypothetical protein